MRPRPGSRRCRRGCSSGSESPRRSWAARGCCCSTSRRVRRADECAGPGRAGDRSHAARRAAESRDVGPPELPPPERGRAGVRPRRDPERGARDHAGPAGGARATPRRRDRRRGWDPAVRGSNARGRSAHRRRAGCRRRAGVRRASSRQHARGDLSRGGSGGDRMTGAAGVLTIVGYALRGSVRRRVFLVVLVLTVGFLALYAVGGYFAFRDVKNFVPPDENILDPTAFTGATLFGLAMFAILFLGSVVAIFLTLGVVRGDAEAGLLQPIVVRPIGGRTIVVARLAGAAAVAAGYVLVVYAVAL